MAKLVTLKLIETQTSRGDGTTEDPYRTVTEWWTVDGEKIYENDITDSKGFEKGRMIEFLTEGK